MLLTAPLLSASFLAATVAELGQSEIRLDDTSLESCHKIAEDISSASRVFFPRAYLIP
jgi:hypothetical protein